MLTLRKPKERDIILYNLASDHAQKFLDDYHEINKDYAFYLINDKDTIVIDDKEFPVGVVWFDQKIPGLHSSVHFLIRPEYWKQFLKQELHKACITQAFEEQDIKKLCAYTMNNQKTAVKLLKMLGFYEHKVWRSHTHQQGKCMDVTFFELKRSSWNKRNALSNGNEIRSKESQPQLSEV